MFYLKGIKLCKKFSFYNTKILCNIIGKEVVQTLTRYITYPLLPSPRSRKYDNSHPTEMIRQLSANVDKTELTRCLGQSIVAGCVIEFVQTTNTFRRQIFKWIHVEEWRAHKEEKGPTSTITSPPTPSWLILMRNFVATPPPYLAVSRLHLYSVLRPI